MLPRRSRSRAPRRLSISFTQLLGRLFLSWETRAFNESLYLWGQRFSRVLKIWFSAGIVFGVIMMITVFVMLVLALGLVVRSGGQKSVVGGTQESRQLVTFVVPGINVPWSDLPYIIFSMICAVGFHELGHAVAATSEGVQIEYIALFLACLVPGALVALSDDCLRRLSPVRALRIYCAGVWHNCLCCAGCYVLTMLLPMVLCPVYLLSRNPLVINVPAVSPLVGHVMPGDSILEVARLQLHSPEDWSQHLNALHFQELERTGAADAANKLRNDSLWESSHSIATQGICVPWENLGDRRTSPGSTCSDNEVLFFELPCGIAKFNEQKVKPQAAFCLMATDVVQHPSCGNRHKPEMASNSCSCGGNGTCLLPVLHHGEALIEIRIKDSSSEGCSLEVTETRNTSVASCQQSVIFIGDPRALVYSLHLTKYWPREISFLGLFNVSFWRWLPDMLEKLLAYIFCISLAMAVLNSAPVFYLDGEAIFQTWLSLASPYIYPGIRRRILHIVLTIGSILLVVVLVCGLLRTVF